MKEDEKKRTISKDLALAVWGIVFNESMMPLVKPLSTFIAEVGGRFWILCILVITGVAVERNGCLQQRHVDAKLRVHA